MPFGTGRFDFYGGDRPGQNLFANSLVALDARTGKRLWHYQIVHHDVWDYDLPVAPKLLTIRHNGRRRDVVAQATKQGFLFVFDRVTGEPIWPIEERPVPQSDVPGERTWPTQPFPTRPAPFARQSFTEHDINPYLPEEERRAIRERLRSYRNDGLFTPPSFRGSIEMPGHSGGTNWGAVAADPGSGELFVLSKALPAMIRLVMPGVSAPGTSRTGGATIVSADEAARLTREANDALLKGPVRFTSPYDFMFTSTYLSPIGPPWSEIVAYDLNSGDIKWRVPHGTVAAPAEIGIPPTSGAHWPRGGLLLTGGGLLFAASGSDKTFRAYDRRTGQVVWTVCAAGGIRWRAGVVRSRRTSVHPGAGRSRQRLEPCALSNASAGPGGFLHGLRSSEVAHRANSIGSPAAGHRHVRVGRASGRPGKEMDAAAHAVG